MDTSTPTLKRRRSSGLSPSGLERRRKRTHFHSSLSSNPTQSPTAQNGHNTMPPLSYSLPNTNTNAIALQERQSSSDSEDFEVANPRNDFHHRIEAIRKETLSSSEPNQDRTEIADNNKVPDSEYVPANGQTTFNTNQSQDNTDAVQVDRTVRKAVRYLSHWERLLPFATLVGSIQFSRDALTILRMSVSTASNGTRKVPTYKTVKTRQWDFMRDNLFVSSSMIYVGDSHVEEHRQPCTKTVSTVNKEDQDIRDCVRMVLPSSWACYDIQTLPIYNELYGTDVSNKRKGISIEDAPLLKDCDRNLYLTGSRTIWALYRNTFIPSARNELLYFPIGKTIRTFQFTENSEWFEDIKASNHFKGRVGRTWCVHSIKSEDDNQDNLEYISDFTPDEHLLYLYTSTATHEGTDFSIELSKKTIKKESPDNVDTDGDRHNCPTNYNTLFLFPGDYCTLFRLPSRKSESAYIAIFIASQIWREGGRVGERIVWINREYLRKRGKYDLSYHKIIKSQDIGDRHFDQFIKDKENFDILSSALPCSASSIELSRVTVVSGAPSFPETSSPKHLYYSNRSVTNKGFLDDGTPYLIYRLFLYMDGFKEKKSLSDQRSVTGCYMLPAGLRHQSKTSSKSVRTITVAPHGIDTNKVLHHIVDDLVNSTVYGIDTHDALGRRVKVFTDIPGILVDTPAQTAANDLRGHTADAPCAYCSTRKRKGLRSPPICYNSTNHCRRHSLMRSDERMTEIRSTPVHTLLQQHIGSTCTTADEASGRISCKLAHALRSKAYDQRHDMEGFPVVDPGFDSFQSVPVVPDHMFKGLITNVLTVCFNSIEDNAMRSHIDKTICRLITLNNLHSIDTVLHWDKHGDYKGINNLKTSALFCVSVFAAPILKQYGAQLKKCHSGSQAANNDSQTAIAENASLGPQPFDLPSQLQDIISLAYWCPQRTQNTNEDIQYVFGSGNKRPHKFFGDLQRMVSSHISSIKDYYEQGGLYANELDKPNAHRLIEFVHQTIPMFGHALNVSEMVLEQAHRDFKTWLEKNTNQGSHVTAVELELAKDWMNRVYAHHMLYTKGDAKERKESTHGLSRLLLGAIAHSTPTDPHFQDYESLLEKLPKSLEPPVLEIMRGNGTSTLLSSTGDRWELDEKCKRKDVQRFFDGGVDLLRQSCLITVSTQPSNFKCYAIARLERRFKCGHKSGTNTFNTISVGTFISAKADISHHDLVFPHSDSESIHYYVVYTLLKTVEEKRDWAVVKSLTENKENMTYSLSSSTQIQVLEITDSVTVLGKVPAAHDFGGSPYAIPDAIMDYGVPWIILQNRDGFPPRIS